MTQLPLGGVYVPPTTNAPPFYLTASPDGSQHILDAWTGGPTTLYGCTFYLSTQGGAAAWQAGDISAIIDGILTTAQANGLNMVRPTDFFDDHTATQVWDDPTVWTNLDYLMSAAQRRGMYVLMDVSAWAHWMTSQGGTGAYDPTVAANWTAMLDALGAHYQNARNICWYSINGEPAPPTDAASTTTLVNFYQSVTDTLAAADPNHLVSAGGFNRMEEHLELRWWEQIYALPHNHICSYKTYSQDDLDLVNFIGRYVATLGKPLDCEEFGAEQVLGDTVYSGTPWNGFTSSMAAYYREVYRRGWQAGVCSFVFWNLGYGAGSTSFDIAPTLMPGTWQIVHEAATGQSPATLTVDGQTLDAATLVSESGSLQFHNAVGQRSTCDLSVLDVAGSQHYEQGEPVLIEDDFSQRLYAGVITDAVEKQTTQGALLEHAVQCADWHYLADKRRFPYSAVSKSVAGIVADMLAQVLAAEGVVAAFGGNVLSPNQSLGAEQDLQGFVAINNGVLSQDATQVCPLAGGLGGSLKVVCSGAQGFQGVEARIPIECVPGINGAQVTISAYMKAASGTPTLRFYVQGASSNLGATTTVTLSTTWTRYTWTATMPNPVTGGYLSLRVDTGGTLATTFWMDGLQVELGAAATAWQLGGPATVQAGPTIGEFTSNYETCAACLDALAQAFAAVWQIDAYKVLWMGVQGQQIAPWSATDSDMERDTVAVEHTNPSYRNRQYLLGATDETVTQVETRVGDGTNTTFTMGYPLAKAPTVEVNIAGGGYVTKTVGIGQVDTGKDWYWNAGKNEIVQDTSGTKLTSADTLRVTYVGEFPIVVLSSADGEVAAQLAREDGVGTGYVEDVQQDATLKTRAGAFQVAGGYIARYARVGKKLTFRTKRGGLAQGQLVSVTVPGHGLNGEQMLIESVAASHDGLRFWYDVTALEGPINDTWPQFFQRLASQRQVSVDQINLGSSSTLALLQQFTATKATAATFTTTVYACPLFPWTLPVTLC